jgi:phosphoribosyl-AMP cyclohydrolase
MQDLFKQLETAAEASRRPFSELLAALKFNQDGLIPVIAQQFDTRQVLMLAWMNRQVIDETLKTGRVCYWSRSRQAYWRKGETSGHIQLLKEMRIDCDGDTLLILVDQQGPACHTQRRDCFYHRINGEEAEINSAY